MIVVAHEVDEVEGLGHHGDVVRVVDGPVSGGNGGRDHQIVFLEFRSHLEQQGRVVFAVFRESGTVISATCLKFFYCLFLFPIIP